MRLLAVTLALASLAASAEAQLPPGTTVSPTGLHVALDADPTAARVVWIMASDSPGPSPVPVVQFGPTPSYGSVATGTSVRLQGEWAVVWSARLTGLPPGSDIHYRVGSDLHGWTSDNVFTTPPIPGRERFVVTAYGDQGSAYERTTAGGASVNGVGSRYNESDPTGRVVKAVLERDPDLHLHLGDISYGAWDGWQLTTEPLASTVPYMATIGNHDIDKTIDLENYVARLPMPAKPGEHHYAFTWGNARFIALDSENACVRRVIPGTTPMQTGYTKCTEEPNDAQVTWIEDELASARRDPAIEWVIPFFHRPMVSDGKHGPDEILNTLWLPVFEKHKPDLVLQGHDHLYARSKPLLGGEVDPDGIVYVVSGGAGRKLYDFRNETSPAWEAARAKEFHFLSLAFDGDRLTVEAVDLEGKVLDAFTLESRASRRAEDPLSERTPKATPAAPFALALLAGLAAARFARRR